MSERATRVVVLGGGYAGAVAANRLCRPGIEVTLVNPRAEFVERIRLHQRAAGTGKATQPYDGLLGAGVRLVVDRAERIDVAAGQVTLAAGAPLDYDHLVYAVGSTAAGPAIPGAAEHGHPLGELEYADRLRATVEALPAGGAIVVVGAGLTGVEAAAEFAETGRRVTLVCGGELTPSLGVRGRRAVARRLRQLGVAILESRTVTEVYADAVALDDGSRRPSAVTVLTAGFGVPDLARTSGLSVDDVGRLLVDETLTSVDDDRIVAAGDCASPSGRPLRMSCQAAGPMGAQAADTVLSRIAGERPVELDQAFTGQCVGLGRHSAVIQLNHKDDTPIGPAVYAGPWSGGIKEQVCRATIWATRREAEKPGSYFWFKGGRRLRDEATTAAEPEEALAR